MRDYSSISEPVVSVYSITRKSFSRLSKSGNPSEELHKVMDCEIFGIETEGNTPDHVEKSNAGCKPHDVAMMFKTLLSKLSANAIRKKKAQSSSRAR
jgi:hypothetical protein